MKLVCDPHQRDLFQGKENNNIIPLFDGEKRIKPDREGVTLSINRSREEISSVIHLYVYVEKGDNVVWMLNSLYREVIFMNRLKILAHKTLKWMENYVEINPLKYYLTFFRLKRELTKKEIFHRFQEVMFQGEYVVNLEYKKAICTLFLEIFEND